MNFPGKGFRENATEKILQFWKDERVFRGIAGLLLGGAVVMSGKAAMWEDGKLSEEERSSVMACATRLTDQKEEIYEFSFPEECSDFSGKFISDVDHGVLIYTLPARDHFIDQELWTSTLEEDRKADYNNALVLTLSSLAIYGGVAFKRRVQEVSVAYEAEQYLASLPGQQ